MIRKQLLLPLCENRCYCFFYFLSFAQALHGCRQPVVPSRPVFWARATPLLSNSFFKIVFMFKNFTRRPTIFY